MVKKLLHCSLLLLCAAAFVWAQSVSGTLSGRVTSAAGTGVPNAAVTVTNTSTNQSQRVLTGPDGSFTVSGLAPGTYRVDIETAGFKRTSQQNIELTTSGPATVNVTLEVGSMNETVEIKGKTPGVQTDNAEMSMGLGTRTVRQLPSVDRNHDDFVALTTGVTPPEPALDIVRDPVRNRVFSTNGQDPRANIDNLDGVVNLEPFRGVPVRVIPTETVQQMNMVTSNYTTDRGFAGGMWTNHVTRGGTNGWHGSLFEFHSDNDLRARSFFNTAGNSDPKFVYNQFGATAGGQIVRDRIFFFGSYEGTYDRGGDTVVSTVPTTAAIGGNFSAIPGLTLYNPRTGAAAGTGRTAFSNGIVPAGQINPAAASIASYFPAPNLGGFANNYVSNVPYQRDGQRFDGRLDDHFSDRTSAFLRYGYSNWRSMAGSPLGDVIGAATRNRLIAQNAVGNVTHEFGPSVIMELRLGYNRYQQSIRDANNPSPLFNSLGISGASNLLNVQIPGLPAIGTPAWSPMNGVDNTYNIQWQTGWHTTSHNLKFGIDARRYRSDGFRDLPFGPAGAAIFGPGATMLANGPALSQYGAFYNSFAAFLLGAPSQAGIVNFTDTPTYRQSQYAAWIGDTLQFHRRVTLDLGVRAEAYSPIEPRLAGGGSFWNSARNTLGFYGVNGNPHGPSMWDYDAIAPRIGIAVRATEKTAIRAGYSMQYFEPPFQQSGLMPSMYGGVAGVAGGFTTVSGAGAFSPVLNNLNTPPAAGAAAVAGTNLPLTVVPRHLDTPYVQSFSLQVQQDFVYGTTLSLGYVGSLGRHLPYFQELNAALPGAGVAGLPFASLGQTSSVLWHDNGVTNNYNSLQVSLNRRFAHGLMFTGSYTYAKALGYTTAGGMLLNPFNTSANYGPMDYDRQHVLTIAHLWELPFGAGTHHLNHGVISQIVGNWQINGIFTWATGTPFTVFADPVSCACPGNTVLANVNGPVNFTNSIGNGQPYFNTAAFSVPALGHFGNLGRNSLRGPSFKNYDLSLFRSFVVRENYKLEFRGEAFNLTNTPRFANPETNLNSGSFGQIINPMMGSRNRQVNVGVRLLF